MEYSKHAKNERMPQRAISVDDTEKILKEGRIIKLPTGAYEFGITDNEKKEMVSIINHKIKELEEQIAFLRRDRKRYEKISPKRVLTSPDQSKVVTVYNPKGKITKRRTSKWTKSRN